MGDVEQIDKEQLLASAATFLIEGDDEEAARVLLDCRIGNISEVQLSSWAHPGLVIELRGPRRAYDALTDYWPDSPAKVGQRVSWAFDAILPHGWSQARLEVRAELVPIDPDWRTQLSGRAQGTAVDNQASTATDFILWNNLRFRSSPEVKIGDALDRAGVLFFPLCRGRLNLGDGRATREPDFLICHQGKWGILEVDGETWHSGTVMAAKDHARDRLFKEHGVKVVEHFEAKHCSNTPDMVVKRFLGILAKSG